MTVCSRQGQGVRGNISRAVDGGQLVGSPVIMTLIPKGRSLVKRIVRTVAERMKKKADTTLYKQLPRRSPVPSEFFKGFGDVRIHIICYERLNDWILGKFAVKLCENVRLNGIECTLANAPDPSADINHHICYIGYQGRRTNNDTLMITHVDTPPKGELKRLLRQIDSVEMGVCMSTATMNNLASRGVSRPKLCFINPAHDGIISSRKIRIGITQRIYPDGRKREHLLLELASTISPDDFSFHIMGSGWHTNVEKLRAMLFEVHLLDRYVKSEYDKLFCSIDYYLYWGVDEGSLGFLDALAAGVPTIVSAQGFHLDAQNSITHLFKNDAELYQIFEQLAGEKRKRQNAVKNWTWKNYACKHLLMWNYVIARKSNLPLPPSLQSGLREIAILPEANSLAPVGSEANESLS